MKIEKLRRQGQLRLRVSAVWRRLETTFHGVSREKSDAKVGWSIYSCTLKVGISFMNYVPEASSTCVPSFDKNDNFDEVQKLFCRSTYACLSYRVTDDVG